MLLPTNCQYAEGKAMPEDGLDTIACCRARRSFWAPAPHDALCRCPGEDVYRFTWNSSFDGSALVQIARQGEDIMLRWEYHKWFPPVGGPGCPRLSMADWSGLVDALGAAAFWSLDPNEDHMGFDGSWWTVAGRNGNSFPAVSRCSPAQGGFRNLGRLFFRLAGPPLATVRLY